MRENWRYWIQNFIIVIDVSLFTNALQEILDGIQTELDFFLYIQTKYKLC